MQLRAALSLLPPMSGAIGPLGTGPLLLPLSQPWAQHGCSRSGSIVPEATDGCTHREPARCPVCDPQTKEILHG